MIVPTQTTVTCPTGSSEAPYTAAFTHFSCFMLGIALILIGQQLVRCVRYGITEIRLYKEFRRTQRVLVNIEEGNPEVQDEAIELL